MASQEGLRGKDLAERKNQRKEESAESLKNGKVVPTGPVQRTVSGRKDSGRGVWWREVPQEGQRSFEAPPILARKLLLEEQKPEMSWKSVKR